MTTFEGLSIGYFLALAGAAWWTDAPRSRQGRLSIVALGLAAAIALVATSSLITLRLWLPHAYLLAGYWMPAHLATVPQTATHLEGLLRRGDAIVTGHLHRLPSWIVRVLESAYLMCYPVVPAAFTVIWVRGGGEDVTRFWVAVLTSGYACYMSLPWLISRPPRLTLDTAARHTSVRVLNLFVLDRFSHGLNTFPSGHVAVACAAAGSVTAVAPIMGAILWIVAAGIAAGAFVGRYHYAADVIIGAIVGAVTLAFARLV